MKNVDSVVLTVMKILGQGQLSEDDMGSSCLYCYGDAYSSVSDYSESAIRFEHEESCTITQARRWLTLQGCPIQIYHATFELNNRDSRWQAMDLYLLATEEKELLRDYETYTLRNVMIRHLGPLPERGYP